MQGLEGLTLPTDNAARTEVTGTTAGSMANIPRAESTGEAGSERWGTSLRQRAEQTREMKNLRAYSCRIFDQNSLGNPYGERESARESRTGETPARRRGMGLQQPGEHIHRKRERAHRESADTLPRLL